MTLDLSAYKPSPGANGDAGQVSSGFTAIEVAVNAILASIAALGPAGDVCAVVNSGAGVSCLNSTNVTLPWDTEVVDNNSIHDPVTNNSRLTCRRTGVYQVTWQASVQNAAGTWLMQATLLKNGSPIAAPNGMIDSIRGDATWSMASNVTGFVSLTVNDYIELRVNQNQGGTMLVNRTGEGGLFAMRQVT